MPFGQSAVAGWLGYSAGEKVAQAFDAKPDTATTVGLVTGLVVGETTAIFTADPIGAVVTPPLLMIRANSEPGATGALDILVTGANTVVNILSGGGGGSPLPIGDSGPLPIELQLDDYRLQQLIPAKGLPSPQPGSPALPPA